MDFSLKEEQARIQALCQELAADFEKRAAAHDRDSSAPVENWEALKRAGLHTISIPRSLGGLEGGLLGWSVAAEQLARGCASTALTFTMHVGAVATVMDDPIHTLEVRQRVASLVLSGKLISAGISESGSSSLLYAQSTVPTVQARKVPNGYLVTGRKTFLSMVESSDFVMLSAHPAEDPDPRRQLFLLIPRDALGQRVEVVWDAIGLKATRSNNLILEDCFVPDDCLLSRIDDVPKWFRQTPSWGPGWHQAGCYLGLGWAIYGAAIEHLKKRIPHGFAQPLSHHPDIRRQVAEMNVALQSARLLWYHATWLVDSLRSASHPSAQAALSRGRYAIGDSVARVARTALTICGAHALFKTSTLERLYRDSASAAIMPPSVDACLGMLGVMELDLDPRHLLPPLKVAG